MSAETTVTNTLREELTRLLAARDRAGAVATTLAAVRDGAISVPALYACVLGPVLAEIGESWQHGLERVWEEHFASATVRTIVESLYTEVTAQASRIPPRGQVAVLACPPDEQHDLGLRMLADRMMLVGWEVYFLGANTPDAELIAAAKTLQADMIVLTVATHFNRVELRETIERLTAELPQVRIGVGGPAFGRVDEWPEDEILTEAMLGLERDAECEH